MAWLYQSVNELPKATAAAGAAAALYARLMDEFPDDPEYPAAASEVQQVFGNAASASADFPTASRAFGAAVALARRAADARPDDPPTPSGWCGRRSAFVTSTCTPTSPAAASSPARPSPWPAALAPADAPYDCRVEYAHALFLAANYDLAAGDFKSAGGGYGRADEVLKGLAGQAPPSCGRPTPTPATRAVVTIQLGAVAFHAARTARPVGRVGRPDAGRPGAP